MTIFFNAATDKYPAKLNINKKSVELKDVIAVSELIAHCDDSRVSIKAVMTEGCSGVENYKDKTWKPGGNVITFSFYRDKKPTWNQDEKKMVDTAVDEDENYLYTRFKYFLEAADADCFSGTICPYINPFFYELVEKQNDTATQMAEEIVSRIIVLTPTALNKLTLADLTALGEANKSFKGGNGYAKAQSEGEKLAERLLFLQTQLEPIIQFKSLAELAITLSAMEGAGGNKAAREAVDIALRMMK